MKHTYQIKGMTCHGCRYHVESALSKVEGISSASVDLEKAEAVLEMKSHVSLETLQKAVKGAGGFYSLHPPGVSVSGGDPLPDSSRGTGTFYCPMQCEGDKIYHKPGDCPVCGMDLVEEQSLSSVEASGQWTCPMHPEVVEQEPGSCPVCGMDLVPAAPELSAEEKTYRKLLRKFWISLAFMPLRAFVRLIDRPAPWQADPKVSLIAPG